MLFYNRLVCPADSLSNLPSIFRRAASTISRTNTALFVIESCTFFGHSEMPRSRQEVESSEWEVFNDANELMLSVRVMIDILALVLRAGKSHTGAKVEL